MQAKLEFRKLLFWRDIFYNWHVMMRRQKEISRIKIKLKMTDNAAHANWIPKSWYLTPRHVLVSAPKHVTNDSQMLVFIQFKIFYVDQGRNNL